MARKLDSTKIWVFGKSVLRAERTRGPQMAKIQNSKNPIRDGQKVGRVPISMGDGLKNPNGAILDQNPLDTKNPRTLDPGLVGPIGPYWPTGVFFADTSIGPRAPFGGLFVATISLQQVDSFCLLPSPLSDGRLGSRRRQNMSK